MGTRYSAKTLVIAAVLLALAAGLLYWGYNAYKLRELRSAVSAIVKDAGGRLREGLNLEGASAADRLQVAKQHDELAAALDKLTVQLKQLPAERDRALMDNADSHLITIREILRKRAASNRLYVLHTESLGSLQDHMRADNRTGAWVKQAVSAKERAEKDFRDYRLAVATYATLLGTLGSSQKKLAPRVGPGVLVEEDLFVKARDRAVETTNQAAAEMEKVRRLAAPK